MFRYLVLRSRTGARYYSAATKDMQDRYVARLMPKKIWKASNQTPNFESEEKIEEISKTVQKYLKSYEKNAEFFKERNFEFEEGKRHLANIMGYDPDNITQEQIDDAIKYLFPSGLFQFQSLPVMKAPSEIYPKFKTALYDKSGRPFSTFFYTRYPNYFESLYELSIHYEDLNRIEDQMIAQGVQATEADKFNICLYAFITETQMQNLFIESLKPMHYERFINHLNKLIDHPFSALKTEFILKFTRPKLEQKVQKIENSILVDEEGREYVEASGFRNTVECKVRVYKNGTGKFLINNKYTMNFFKYLIYREQILSPLVAANLVEKVDIYVTIEPIDEPLHVDWPTAYSGAIRFGVSQALLPFVDEETAEILRVSGYLQRDIRKKERKKPGQKKARKGRAYRKR